MLWERIYDCRLYESKRLLIRKVKRKELYKVKIGIKIMKHIRVTA